MNKCLSNLSLIVITLLLSSCGQNTKDWPRTSFTFTYEMVIETKLYFHQKANNYVKEIYDSRESSDALFSKRVIESITALPYKEKKEKTVDAKNYSLLLSIQFTYLNDNVEEIENIIFYEYGISNGKVVFNNGDIHYFPGTVRVIYNSIVDGDNR